MIEYHIIPQLSLCLILEEIVNYCDSFVSHREPSSEFDLDLMTLRDLDCLPLDWFLVVNKGCRYFRGCMPSSLD